MLRFCYFTIVTTVLLLLLLVVVVVVVVVVFVSFDKVWSASGRREAHIRFDNRIYTDAYVYIYIYIYIPIYICIYMYIYIYIYLFIYYHYCFHYCAHDYYMWSGARGACGSSEREGISTIYIYIYI